MPQSPLLRRAFCRKSQDSFRENGTSHTGIPPPLLGPIWPQRRLPTKDSSIDAAPPINHFSNERKAYSESVLFWNYRAANDGLNERFNVTRSWSKLRQ